MRYTYLRHGLSKSLITHIRVVKLVLRLLLLIVIPKILRLISGCLLLLELLLSDHLLLPQLLLSCLHVLVHRIWLLKLLVLERHLMIGIILWLLWRCKRFNDRCWDALKLWQVVNNSFVVHLKLGMIQWDCWETLNKRDVSHKDLELIFVEMSLLVYGS